MAEIILAQSLPPDLNLPNLNDLACDDGISKNFGRWKLIPTRLRNNQENDDE